MLKLTFSNGWKLFHCGHLDVVQVEYQPLLGFGNHCDGVLMYLGS